MEKIYLNCRRFDKTSRALEIIGAHFYKQNPDKPNPTPILTSERFAQQCIDLHFSLEKQPLMVDGKPIPNLVLLKQRE